MLGANDSKEENWNKDFYHQDLYDLVLSYLQLDSKPTLYLMIPFRIENTEGVKIMRMQPDVIENVIPPIMKEITKKLNNRLIDLSHLFSDPKDHDRIFQKGEEGYWTGDGVHPTDDGYKRLATYIHDNLKLR